jgi:hypothetical protein
MQIRAADRRLDDFDNGIRRRGDIRLQPVLERSLPRSVVDKPFMCLAVGIIRTWANYTQNGGRALS